ncbi:uncharacterized protein [Apostichopus japonicus]
MIPSPRKLSEEEEDEQNMEPTLMETDRGTSDAAPTQQQKRAPDTVGLHLQITLNMPLVLMSTHLKPLQTHTQQLVMMINCSRCKVRRVPSFSLNTKKGSISNPRQPNN